MQEWSANLAIIALFAAGCAWHLDLWRRRHQLRTHLWFAIFCALAIAWTLANLAQRSGPLANTSSQVSNGLSWLVMAAAVEFFAFFLHGRAPTSSWRLLQAAAGAFAALRLFPSRSLHALIHVPLSILFGASGLALVIAVGREAWRGHRPARLLIVGISVTMVLVIPFQLADADIGGVPLPLFGAGLLLLSMNAALSEHYTRSLEELDQRQRDLELLYRATRRFVPEEFLRLLGKPSLADIQRADHIKREMSVLFSDIRDFTPLAESLSPEETFTFVNAYFSFVEPTLRAHRGVVCRYLGDGLMAMFPDSADDAVAAGVAMLEAVARFNASRAASGAKPIQIGVGVHTGTLMLGTVGGSEQLDMTIIGDVVNLASRVEGMTKLYGASLLLSEATCAALRAPERFMLRKVDRVVPKGKSTPLDLFEVLDGEPTARREAKLAGREDFARACEHLRAGRLAEARAGFAPWAAEDPTAAFHVHRLDALLAEGVPAGWDGVTRLDHK